MAKSGICFVDDMDILADSAIIFKPQGHNTATPEHHRWPCSCSSSSPSVSFLPTSPLTMMVAVIKVFIVAVANFVFTPFAIKVSSDAVLRASRLEKTH